MSMQRKLPKIIHYCWFGGTPIPRETLEYIKTWKEKCSDYEFRKWDESNFDIEKYDYTKEAYLEKKWAFISDVCRLEKIYEFGGIYLDVNTKVLKNFDQLLENEMFVGFEQDNKIQMGVFGAKERHPLIKKLLDEYYRREHLLDVKGVVNLRTINDRAQEELLKLGMKPENSFQQLSNITVYPKEYFCPRYWNSSRQDSLTGNTYTIHYFGASWHNEEVRNRLKTQRENIDQLVSVIVPVYNVGKYLDECITSIINQTYTNLEIVLVDDASTDNSGKICDQWALKDRRIKVEHKPKNSGLNMARKTGFDQSKGQYITFLDSDDIFHEENIERSLNVLLDNKADVSIYSSKEFRDSDSISGLASNNEKLEVKLFTTKDQIANFAFFGDGSLEHVQYMTVWGKLYSRKLVNGIDWEVSDYRVYEDAFWTPQALLKAQRVAVMSTPLIYYRRNITYGTNGANLGNRLTGNSINDTDVGYLEYVELMQKYYHKLARECGFDSKLDDRIDRHAFLSKTWRIDNLANAGLLDSENNLDYVRKDLAEYINSKNKHIENLNADITYLDENLSIAKKNLTDREADVEQLKQKLAEFTGIKRSAKLLAGNIKRKIIRTHD